MIIIHAQRQLPGTVLLEVPALTSAVSLSRQRLPCGDLGGASILIFCLVAQRASQLKDSSPCHEAPQAGWWIAGGGRRWMTRMTPTTRSLAPIGRGDLLRLGVLSAEAD